MKTSKEVEELIYLEGSLGSGGNEYLCDYTQEERIKLIEDYAKDSKKCNWTMAFDGHYNLSCANETNERGNHEFNNKWKFKYCPYCGGKIDFTPTPKI